MKARAITIIRVKESASVFKQSDRMRRVQA
jgi:hypothetical protein